MLDFGYRAEATDEPDAGTVSGAVYDRGTWELVAVIVRRGALATRDIVVPAGSVVGLAPDLVTLSITTEEMEGGEDFRLQRLISPEQDFQPPGAHADQPGAVVGTAPVIAGDPLNPFTVSATPTVVETVANVPEGTAPLVLDQTVVTSDGVELGGVAHLVYDGDALSGIAVDSERPFGSGRIVPVGLIAEAGADQVLLSVNRAGYEQLPDAPVA